MNNKELAGLLREAACRADIEMNGVDGAYVVSRISTVIDTLEKSDDYVEELQTKLAAAAEELTRYRNGYKGACYACETVGEKNVELEANLSAAERDAERLEWMAEHNASFNVSEGKHHICWFDWESAGWRETKGHCIQKSTWRDAIDAARSDE